MTALMCACAPECTSGKDSSAKQNEAVAVLLMEATQKAGALDVQVNVVWSVCWEGGWAGGGGRGRGGEGGTGGSQSHKRVGRGTDTCVFLQHGTYQRSALHYASMNGLESAVAKLLSLGADAALKDKVRACSYMNTCMYSVDVCKRVAHTYLSLYNAYHTDMLQYYACVCVCVDTHTQRHSDTCACRIKCIVRG